MVEATKLAGLQEHPEGVSAALERLRLHLTAFNPRSRHTLYQYDHLSGRFLNGAHIPPSPDDVVRFIAGLESQAYKQFVFFILRRLFGANGWTWPFPEGSAPKIREQNQVKLPVETIASLIAARNRLTPQQIFYLAMGTVYGFRREELSRITAENFPEPHTIQVPTVKGGRVRLHSIPEELWEWLEPPSERISVDRAWHILKEIAEVAGVQLPPHGSWHAIRRQLISQLGLKCPILAVTRFIGWRGGPGPKIFYLYAQPEEEDIDPIVYEHHPFLGFWR